jgi:hypothetical protein
LNEKSKPEDKERMDDKTLAILGAAVNTALEKLPADSPYLEEILTAMAAECLKKYDAEQTLPPEVLSPRDVFAGKEKEKSYEMDWDGVKSKITWRRQGDTVELIGEGEQCPCPLMASGVIKPNPKLCECGRILVKMQYERAKGPSARIELAETFQRGSSRCIWRYHLQPKEK